MKKTKIKVLVRYEYEIEIDNNNEVVKDYENHDELIEDCCSYRFSSTLPVISSEGVVIKDVELKSYQSQIL